jgi:hypothetical protein
LENWVERRWPPEQIVEGYSLTIELRHLPPAFAHSAAYGDIISATLALLSLLSLPRGAGVVTAWIQSLGLKPIS